MEHMDGEAWRQERVDDDGGKHPSFHDIFFGDPLDVDPESSSRAKMEPAKPGQQGSLNIKPREKAADVVTDFSQFVGRAGGTGKADPNKAMMVERAKHRAEQGQKPSIRIAPQEGGGLSVETDHQ